MKVNLILSFIILIILNTNQVFSQEKNIYRANEVAVYKSSHYEEAIKSYNRGNDLTNSYKFKKAIKYYKKAITIDTNYVDAYDNCALAYRNIWMLDSAELYYLKSLKIMPDNDVALNNVGVIYIMRKEYDKAEKVYRNIIKINNGPDGYFGLANIYQKKEIQDSVIVNGLKAYEHWDNNKNYASDALYLVGNAYYEKKDIENAKNYFGKSAKLGNQYSVNFLRKIESETNK